MLLWTKPHSGKWRLWNMIRWKITQNVFESRSHFTCTNMWEIFNSFWHKHFFFPTFFHANEFGLEHFSRLCVLAGRASIEWRKNEKLYAIMMKNRPNRANKRRKLLMEFFPWTRFGKFFHFFVCSLPCSEIISQFASSWCLHLIAPSCKFIAKSIFFCTTIGNKLSPQRTTVTPAHYAVNVAKRINVSLISLRAWCRRRTNPVLCILPWCW